MKKTVVIGGGAAGIMAAGISAEKGNEVHLFEKNNKLGKKIYITGKGRCNLTNSGDIQNFMDNIPGNPFFLYSSFYNFSNIDTINFFKELGLETKVERGGRVFPISDKAEDVVETLERFLKKYRVNVHYEESVDNILIENNKVLGVSTRKHSEFRSDSVIIATGGLSYPLTGSTGDGYKMAKTTGHKITKLYPSLVPLVVKEKWCSELQGLSLKNIGISIENNNGKAIYKDFGELMFTHYGVSGPVILSSSRNIIEEIEKGLVLSIDLKPALDEKTLDTRILRDFEKFKNKAFKNSLNELFPQKLIPIIVMLSDIPPDKKVNEITKEKRKKLCGTIKKFLLHITATKGYNEAVITSGGIDINQIDPVTMESKILKNLFFAGEIIDVDAYTGGYNLQIAFSTGYTAGINS